MAGKLCLCHPLNERTPLGSATGTTPSPAALPQEDVHFGPCDFKVGSQHLAPCSIIQN